MDKAPVESLWVVLALAPREPVAMMNGDGKRGGKGSADFAVELLSKELTIHAPIYRTSDLYDHDQVCLAIV